MLIGLIILLSSVHLGMVTKAKLLEKSAWMLDLIDDKALPAARDGCEVERA